MPGPVLRPDQSRSRTIQFGSWFCAIHFGVFMLSAFLAGQFEGWAAVIVWPLWLIVDFPVSALHVVFLNPPVRDAVDALCNSSTVLSYLLYPPYLVHGILGSIWWFFLPYLYIRNRHLRLTK
jgi:hypothetical protein